MAKVLIVDDNANNRLLLTSILRRDSHTVLEAENGAVGLEMAVRHEPDLAIVDLHMPEVDGVTVVRHLRANPMLSSMKIAISTGTAMTAAIADFIELYRVDVVIPKPGEPREILEQIRSALS